MSKLKNFFIMKIYTIFLKLKYDQNVFEGNINLLLKNNLLRIYILNFYCYVIYFMLKAINLIYYKIWNVYIYIRNISIEMSDLS